MSAGARGVYAEGRRVMSGLLHELDAYQGPPVGEEPEWVSAGWRFLNRIYWLSALKKPHENSSIYHVISWADEQKMFYNNWNNWLEGLTTNA